MGDQMPSVHKKSQYEPVFGGLSPKSQAWPMLYQMKIKFIADIDILPKGLGLPDFGLPELDGLRLTAGGAAELTLEQTVSFVPDRETLMKYARVLEDGYNKNANGEYRIQNTRFLRYDEFWAQPMPMPAQEPFGISISWDGNYLTLDDGTDQISQAPYKPEEAAQAAMDALSEQMALANTDPLGQARHRLGQKSR
ncbi:MAG: hypothetical protein NC311_13375 [Muribaculaceae bacterium]|nr:hypothetical protein [Muribaculaceae bacterium]